MTQKIITDSDHVSGVSIIEPLVTQQWTQTPPTEPGYWWVMDSLLSSPRIALITETHLKLNHLKQNVWKGAYWLGPITPPEPPEEK